MGPVNDLNLRSKPEQQDIFDYLLPKMTILDKQGDRRYYWHDKTGHLFSADVIEGQLIFGEYLGCSRDENEARRICEA